MNTASYVITGGDFDRVGFAAGDLKGRLKKLGVSPDALRRAVIAAYEAEANIVVHAHKGTLRAMLGPSQIDVEVTDEGPGIPDIELAMQEGFSTASPAARELGFGAGMGLPSIKKNSGSFAIESEVGQGTTIRFSIPLSRFEFADSAGNSVHVVPELCNGCMRCLHVCPTRALRIRRTRPEILGHLCIDCAACIGACEAGALRVPDSVGPPTFSGHSLLAVPASFLVSFGPKVGARQVREALSATGFQSVRVIEQWEAALCEAALEYARQEAKAHPVVSPVCPPVVNLVRTRFPSLIGHVAPFLSPIEAAREELAGQGALVAVSCPAQHTVLDKDRTSSTPEPLNLSRLRGVVLAVALRGGAAATAPPQEPNQPERCEPGVLRASGTRKVVEILDKAESGLLADFALLELFACDQGCFGSPLSPEEPSIARQRWRRVRRDFVGAGKAFRRQTPLVARQGMRLDRDMTRAIEKLHRIDQLTAELPGKNCGMCGAPTCADMAEDVVLGRAESLACPHRLTAVPNGPRAEGEWHGDH